jgi:protein involved in polysaccharide export with SLBB domain
MAKLFQGAWLLALLACAATSGCAALTNPAAGGVPVERLPPEVLGRPREDQKTIPLKLLRQTPPDVYTLDAGDLLGIWIEGVLGAENQPPPVQMLERGPNVTPFLGFPIPVREDGTITLPFIDPIPVRGKSVTEVQEAVRKAYTVTKQVLRPGRERIVVELQRPRQYHVLVLRQDSGGLTVAPTSGSIGSTKRGTGFQLDLPAYENDVLNALARTGGFPGLDARNEVIIERGGTKGMTDPTALQHLLEQCPADGSFVGLGGGEIIRIPLRLRPDEPITFKPEDVILHSGDVVFIESRDTEVFYTGGLLGSGQYVLPRDYDLNVVEAVCLVHGPLVSGGIQQNNFTGTLLANGMGFPSPSLVSIIRRTRGGGQITIKVDLNNALQDPRQRVLIQPKDMIILQETVGEAMARYFTDVFKLNFVGTILRQRDAVAATTLQVP